MLKRRNFILFFFIILLAGTLTPIQKTNAAGGSINIGADNVNVRKGPGLSYPLLGQAKKGDRFSKLDQKGEWIQIEFEEGSKGWVANWLVSINNGSQSTTTSLADASKVTITATGLRMRNGAGSESQVIGTLTKGESYILLAKNGNWVQLKTPLGDGWVSSEYVQIQKEPNSVKSSEKAGKVTGSSLNVRSEPSLQGNIIGKLNEGETVKILSQNNEWIEIDFSGKPSWISSQYIQVEDNQTASSNKEKRSNTSFSGVTGTVSATTLTVRDSGSLNGRSVGTVSNGQSFKILEEANNWSKIEYKTGEFGWVASWFLDKSTPENSVSSQKTVKDSIISILHNGTNIRKKANTQSSVVHRANQGDTFDVVSLQNDWYEIRLSNGESGFVAGWIVSANGTAPKVEKPGAGVHLENKTIVLDPGHGGRDSGTTGARGTMEKMLTLRTAELLYDKLKASGANVILTRSNDTYVPLRSRVSLSHYHNADAFISIHYDSIIDRSVRGMTSYYYHSFQKSLASEIHHAAVSRTHLKDRGYRFGDYHVIRENKRNAVLLELGYLSNPSEEMLVTSGTYQETVAAGIYQGLARYFKN